MHVSIFVNISRSVQIKR